jgi:hypothetical protein
MRITVSRNFMSDVVSWRMNRRVVKAEDGALRGGVEQERLLFTFTCTVAPKLIGGIWRKKIRSV